VDLAILTSAAIAVLAARMLRRRAQRALAPPGQAADPGRHSVEAARA